MRRCSLQRLRHHEVQWQRACLRDTARSSPAGGIVTHAKAECAQQVGGCHLQTCRCIILCPIDANGEYSADRCEIRRVPTRFRLVCRLGSLDGISRANSGSCGDEYVERERHTGHPQHHVRTYAQQACRRARDECPQHRNHRDRSGPGSSSREQKPDRQECHRARRTKRWRFRKRMSLDLHDDWVRTPAMACGLADHV